MINFFLRNSRIWNTFFVGVLMGWDTGSKCVRTEKDCFSFITLHPVDVMHDTKRFISLKPRPTRWTLSDWKRTCRSWEVANWVWPTSQPRSAIFNTASFHNDFWALDAANPNKSPTLLKALKDQIWARRLINIGGWDHELTLRTTRQDLPF